MLHKFLDDFLEKENTKRIAQYVSDHPAIFFPITRPHHFPCLCISLFISLCVLLCVLLSCTVIITSRSSNSFDSVSLADPQLAELHTATNGYLINLSLQVQLLESDKLGNPLWTALLNVYRKDEHAMEGGWWQVLAGLGSGRILVIRLKKENRLQLSDSNTIYI